MNRQELSAIVLELLEKETGETYPDLEEKTSLRASASRSRPNCSSGSPPSETCSTCSTRSSPSRKAGGRP